MKNRPLDRHRLRAGFTLVETMIAAAVAMIGMTAAMSLNQGHMRLVKSAGQSNAATLCLQERVEQMRLASWRKITNADYIKDTLLAVPTRSAAPLDQLWETITISAYPDSAAAKKLIVERRAGGERVTLLSGDGLASERLAQLEFQIRWLGPDRRPRTRMSTTLISNGGISRTNLPGMGSMGGAPPTSATLTPAGTPSPTSTPIPTTTPAPTPTPTPEGTPAPGNGNGNGRGNVGGKPGKL